MEGLGVVGDGVSQRFQVEATVASKGVAGFVFMTSVCTSTTFARKALECA